MSDIPTAAALRRELLADLDRDRWMAHSRLFAHRHPDESPQAHRDLVEAIYRPVPRLSIEGFRGFAKSTYLEEAAIVRAGYRDFRFMVVVGASYDMACSRLQSIKREFEMNEFVQTLFGRQNLKDQIWRENQIVLSNGCCIMALGRDQSMTGIKYLDSRPDAALVDDVENPEEVRTDAEREQTWIWFIKVFLPSLDHPLFSWVRVLGTRRGNGSLPERVERDGWPVVKFPIEHADSSGSRAATWPAKFPLPVIDRMRETYRGDMDTFMQEYMCVATSAADKPFRNIRIAPRVRSWEAVYAMYDPARTTGPRSATTGKAVWSWVRNRLVIWTASAQLWMPSELIDDLFETNDEYGPVWIGVEEDGLNEWIKQPLRQEQAKRGSMAPIKAVKAPRNKLGFIRGLQPYFEAGEVEFAQPLPELEKQLLDFPYGKIDAPNALAYALLLRPGAPVYDQFSNVDHVAERAFVDPGMRLWLACNAVRGLVTAVLLQQHLGRTTVVADWAIEDEPAVAVPLIVREAGMAHRARPVACCGPLHYERYTNLGLVQALQRVPLEVERGVDPAKGRAVLRDDFAKLIRGTPAVQVAVAARHTLRGFAGGYARMLNRTAGIEGEAEDGLYRVLMEGLESCLGRAAASTIDTSDGTWHTSAGGQMYRKYGGAQQRRA